MRLIPIILSSIFIVGCSSKKEELNNLYPRENLNSSDKVELGRRLFFDVILSENNSISCGSCHFPHLAFTDGQALSEGVLGRIGNRNTPSILNAKDLDKFNWDAGTNSIETQMLVPIGDHNEMNSSIPQIIGKLNLSDTYLPLFKSVWKEDANAFTITRSISAFIRTLVSRASKYDEFLQGDYSLNVKEQKGMELFTSDSLNCVKCHTPPLFTNIEMMNNGLDSLSLDSGLAGVTFKPNDLALFKVPSLRNLSFTAPYMHDGRFNTIDEVLNHYASGGKHHFNQSKLIQGFTLDSLEKASLKSFLLLLDDEQAILNPDYQNPFESVNLQGN